MRGSVLDFDGDHDFSLFLGSAPALQVALFVEAQFCASTKSCDSRERITMRLRDNAAHTWPLKVEYFKRLAGRRMG